MDRHCNSIDQLMVLFANMDLNCKVIDLNCSDRPKEGKPETWFWYKGQPIKSKEDFKQLVMREMRLPY